MIKKKCINDVLFLKRKKRKPDRTDEIQSRVLDIRMKAKDFGF